MRKNSLLFFTMVLTVFLAGSVWSDVVLRVDPADVFIGESAVLSFSMDSPDDAVAALQVDILFDGCFTVAPGDVAPTSRTADLSIFQASSIAGGIRIAMTGIGEQIAPGTGAIAEIPVEVGCAEGCYVFDVTGCVVADPLGVEIACAEEDNEVCAIMPMCVLDVDPGSFNFGDVRVCHPAVAPMTVTNVGTAAGDVTIVVTGCASADPLSFPLAVGGSAVVDVDCHPTAEGPCTGTVELTCDGEGGGEPLVVTVTCNGVCSHISTNCPLDFGDVTIVETKDMALDITNTGDADLNVSAVTFDDADFSASGLPLVVAPGATVTVTVTVAPSAAVGAATATATIVSDACEGDVTCELAVNKLAPPFVIMYIDPVCQVIKPYTPFVIQVKVRNVTEVMPISAVYFELCTDTCIAFFDMYSVTFTTGKSVLDSMGWDIKVHYLEVGDTCLQVFLAGGIPLIEDGCLVNITLVPNAVCITANGWECGGAYTDIWFRDAMFNEGEPDDSTEDGMAIINEGPEWQQDYYVVQTTEGCLDYGCPPVVASFIDVDADGDTMAFYRIPDVNWAGFAWDPAIAPYPIDTLVSPLVNGALATDPKACGGASTLEWVWEWCPQKDALHGAGFSAPFVWVDTLVNYSSFTWPGDVVCYDTTLVYWVLERLHAHAYWDRVLDRLHAHAYWDTLHSFACAGPEPIVWLCPDNHYYGSIGALPELIYSVDMILDYDCVCLEPYEVGNEDLDTDGLGALTYTINEELNLICVSIALNSPIPDVDCASLVYVGFRLKTEGETGGEASPCTTCHYAELSIEHVKLNEAGMNVCWQDGWIHYNDFSLVGNIRESAPDSDPIYNVTVEIYDTYPGGTKLDEVYTDIAGNYGFGALEGCQPYCIHPKKDNLGDPYIGMYVTAMDAAWILQSLCHQRPLTHDQTMAADVTCNGEVTAYDAAVLLQWVVGLPVISCIGHFGFEYVGPRVAYQGSSYVCLPEILPWGSVENFEAYLRGDVTMNYPGYPKVAVTTPDVAFAGRNATISMSGDVYSAVLQLVGVTARSVSVPEGMMAEWRSVDGVTKIALAGAEPVVDARVVVEIESGEALELYGNVNEIPFATRTEKVPAIPADSGRVQSGAELSEPVQPGDEHRVWVAGGIEGDGCGVQRPGSGGGRVGEC